jgi:hypothetical protein
MPSRTFSLALLALALTAPAAMAQYSADSGQQPGGHRGRMHGPGRGTPPDPVVLKGPPAPADFQKLVQLPPDKVAGYQGLYDRFMAETKPQRDSLAALRGGMGGGDSGGGDSGDRQSFQQRREVFMPLNQELTRRQAAFDDALKDMLAKDQWKRYQKWRDEERKVAEQQRRDRWRRRGGAAPPGDGQPPA